ncbi:regulatory protein GemA [Pasteurella multocida]|uniref:Regulatory protein GemA n=1 Tax=Pasteurella multocida TaxID=747 RepID=A0A9X3US00_PASMD|nr:regulatory protein GemA [Pasteurella multocida]MDA5623545.1 regulatory protein GemA [Pasteurella multocida]
MNNKQKYIQLIHIAKQQLNMDEYSYRSMLERLTAKNSTAKMTVVELLKVLHELEQKGFKVRSRRGASPKTTKAQVKSKIALKIRAIWIDMAKQGHIKDGSENALNAWVRSVVNPLLEKQHKPIVLNVQALDDHMASIVLERLKKWQARTSK